MIHAFGDWELDIELYELRYRGEPVRLEPQVFDVLAYLVLHRDRVISKQELLSNLWPDQFIGDSALERCIMAARKAIGDSGGQQRIIKTFHRRGYRFIIPVTEHTTHAPHPSGAGPFPSLRHAASNRAAHSKAKRGRFLESRSKPYAERQQATVLSCAFVYAHALAETYGPDESHALLDSLCNRATHQIQEAGGLITQWMDDGVFALFGATMPHEDHALRAVKAALELRELLHEEPGDLEIPSEILAVRMGLHTGEVVGKRFGDDPRVIYMAVEDTMQFAANLQTCADPGSILISATTYCLVQEAVQADVVGLVAVKPRAAPVAAYKLHRMRAHEPAALSLMPSTLPPIS
jgi:DNA-binding winged helix-turn-helix (wHTH) protein